jgi:regulator of protease activity HflC (stomatin/prohibitin superfamily)
MHSPTPGVPETSPSLSWWVGLFVIVGILVVGLTLTRTLTPVGAVGVLILGLAITTLASSVEIVQAYERRPLTVFGRFKEVLGPGITFIPPFVSQTYIFDMRTQTMDVPQQHAITSDNSPVTADAVVYIRVMDAEKAFLEVEDYEAAVLNLAQTTLRAVIGDMELDDTLRRRDDINRRIHIELDEPTDEWGIRVEAVEVREVLPTPTVRDAMEEQTSAERHRRAMILEAQGKRSSSVVRARGDRTAAILRAQGSKQSQILEAQGDALATVLRAKAAESMGERAVIDSSLETLVQLGTGASTTVVLPQELTSLLSRSSRHLTDGIDERGDAPLSAKSFDAETKTFLGLDDIAEMLDAESTDLDVDESPIATDSMIDEGENS